MSTAPHVEKVAILLQTPYVKIKGGHEKAIFDRFFFHQSRKCRSGEEVKPIFLHLHTTVLKKKKMSGSKHRDLGDGKGEGHYLQENL
jgi:hypothetical protein